MSGIAVYGAGAFGTAMAIALSRAGLHVSLWTRDAGHAADMQSSRTNERRLPGFAFPETLTVTTQIDQARDTIAVIAVPTQTVAGFLSQHRAELNHSHYVASCKGVSLQSGLGPTGIIAAAQPEAQVAMLSGPSFASDLAHGRPVALTLAANDDATAQALQSQLSTTAMRIYRTTDVIGVELGGALKNVIAIACGLAMGAGLGESARAALITRGFAEITRFAVARGALPETLGGLSGFGDLVLTCTSAQSRNYSHGLMLGRGEASAQGKTIEGVATARAVSKLAEKAKIEMPILSTVAAILDSQITIAEAVDVLLSRPLKKE